jgi:isopenicillin-N epimerase
MNKTDYNADDPTLAGLWDLDSTITFLNHGSFGACPASVLDVQQAYRRRMESEPVRFFVRELPGLLDESRRVLAGFLGVSESDLVFVTNATTGVNAVLGSLQSFPDDEILITNHGYNACNNAARCHAERVGARVVEALIPFPISCPESVTDAILDRVSPRTRLAIIDHVTSPTALVFPIDEIIRQLHAKGILTLVDGAHAPGMVPLRLADLGAAYYAGNCHKWLCVPKTAGFLYVRPDLQKTLLPPVISHGYNLVREGSSRFHALFDWPGTIDPTPWLCVPRSLALLGDQCPGRLPGMMRRNRELALAARDMLCQALDIEPACPPEMLGSMAAVIVPDSVSCDDDGRGPIPFTPIDPLQNVLWNRFRIEVPVYRLAQLPQRILRISAHLYNDRRDYERLVSALSELRSV